MYMYMSIKNSLRPPVNISKRPLNKIPCTNIMHKQKMYTREEYKVIQYYVTVI